MRLRHGTAGWVERPPRASGRRNFGNSRPPTAGRWDNPMRPATIPRPTLRTGACRSTSHAALRAKGGAGSPIRAARPGRRTPAGPAGQEGAPPSAPARPTQAFDLSTETGAGLPARPHRGPGGRVGPAARPGFGSGLVRLGRPGGGGGHRPHRGAGRRAGAGLRHLGGAGAPVPAQPRRLTAAPSLAPPIPYSIAMPIPRRPVDHAIYCRP